MRRLEANRTTIAYARAALRLPGGPRRGAQGEHAALMVGVPVARAAPVRSSMACSVTTASSGARANARTGAPIWGAGPNREASKVRVSAAGRDASRLASATPNA
jgi:hypothetical protein